MEFSSITLLNLRWDGPRFEGEFPKSSRDADIRKISSFAFTFHQKIQGALTSTTGIFSVGDIPPHSGIIASMYGILLGCPWYLVTGL